MTTANDTRSNPFVAGLDLRLQEKLSTEANLELARRSVPGALMYVLLFVAIVLTSPERRADWLSSAILAALFLVLSLSRVFLGLALQKRYSESPASWSRRFRAGVYATAIVWGAFSAFSIATTSDVPETFLILLVTTGLASAGTVSLAPDLALVRRYQLLLLCPNAVALGFRGQTAWGMAAAVTLYLILLYLQAKQHWGSYWRALQANALLGIQSEELKRARDDAEAGIRAKEQFMANVSHELRTPLNGILGMGRLALETELNEEQKEYVTTVVSCGESLLTIINDVLDLSHGKDPNLELRAKNFRLRQILEETVGPFRQAAQEKGLRLSWAAEAEIPDSMTGDALRLRQLLDRLVSNGIKFTQAGEVKVEVKLMSLDETQLQLHFIVTDTGIGIRLEKQSSIFEPFSQVDTSTTRKYGGTGLGLTIAARLVEVIGGRIWAESEEGRGSAFHFTARFSRDR